MNVNVRDVAREAGVSPATVSRVINGHPQVSAETRERVNRAIKSLGYDMRSSRLAADRRLAALIVPDVTSTFFGEIIAGVERVLFEQECDVVLYNVGDRPLADIINRISKLDVVGLVTVTPHIGEEEQFGSRDLKVPLVVVDYHNEGSASPHVSVDNLRAGYSATRYLIQKGHRGIGMITGPLYVQSAMERLRGFRLALDEAGIAFEQKWVIEGDFTEAGGFAATQAIVSSGGPLPTAIFCSNDLTAAGALRALKQAGVSVPGDMSIVGFDDLPVARLITPALTTMAQPMREMGEIAARMLLRLISGDRLETDRIILEAKLVVRESA